MEAAKNAANGSPIPNAIVYDHNSEMLITFWDRKLFLGYHHGYHGHHGNEELGPCGNNFKTSSQTDRQTGKQFIIKLSSEDNRRRSKVLRLPKKWKRKQNIRMWRQWSSSVPSLQSVLASHTFSGSKHMSWSQICWPSPHLSVKWEDGRITRPENSLKMDNNTER